MITIIKIDKSTVKRNKHAGDTSFNIISAGNISFSGNATQEQIDKLEKADGVYVSSQYFSTDKLISITGVLIDLQFKQHLPPGFNIKVDKRIETINHLPISKYSYGYENTVIPCSNCGNNINYNDIEHDFATYGDMDEFEYDICPVCKCSNTFDYQFENIADIIK